MWDFWTLRPESLHQVSRIRVNQLCKRENTNIFRLGYVFVLRPGHTRWISAYEWLLILHLQSWSD